MSRKHSTTPAGNAWTWNRRIVYQNPGRLGRSSRPRRARGAGSVRNSVSTVLGVQRQLTALRLAEVSMIEKREAVVATELREQHSHSEIDRAGSGENSVTRSPT